MFKFDEKIVSITVDRNVLRWVNAKVEERVFALGERKIGHLIVNI